MYRLEERAMGGEPEPNRDRKKALPAWLKRFVVSSGATAVGNSE
jgi:hypothetical protein